MGNESNPLEPASAHREIKLVVTHHEEAGYHVLSYNLSEESTDGVIDKRIEKTVRVEAGRLRGIVILIGMGAKFGQNEDKEDKGSKPESTLSGISLNLSRALLPDELRERLWDSLPKGENGPVPRLHVISDESLIPWELLSIEPNTKQKSQMSSTEGQATSAKKTRKFLAEAFILTRWLIGRYAFRGFTMSKIGCVIPNDSSALFAHREKSRLLSLRMKNHLFERIEADAASLEAQLERSNHDGWHFAGHGATSIASIPQIELEGKTRLLSTTLALHEAAISQKKPFVFWNSCSSSSGQSILTGRRGWPHEFIEAGAGAFLGTHWEVKDSLAVEFAVKFYELFLGGATAGEAVHQARLHIKDEIKGNPTWLAYTIFSHPEASCTHPAKQTAARELPDLGVQGEPTSSVEAIKGEKEHSAGSSSNGKCETTKRIEEKFSRFGRLGILIDDAKDAELRLALELYAADCLPQWWFCATTIEEGREAMATLLLLLEKSSDRGNDAFPWIVVVDRFLPPFEKKERPFDWSSVPENHSNQYLDPYLIRVEDICHELRQSLITLSPSLDSSSLAVAGGVSPQRSRYPNGQVLLVTSYVPATAQARATIPGAIRRDAWKSRADWPLFQEIHNSNELAGPLQFFGGFSATRTAHYHQVTAKDTDRHDNEPDIAWLGRQADIWQAIEGKRCVLLTGAGMSLPGHSEGAGMPSTSELITRAIWRMCRKYFPGLPEPRGRKGQKIPDSTEGELRAKLSVLGTPPFETTLQNLIDSYIRPEKVVDLIEIGAEFNSIFDAGGGFSKAKCDHFLKCLESEVASRDYGLTQQHYLAAGVPFSLVATTNYDTFHERAHLERQRKIRISGSEWGSDSDGGLFRFYGTVHQGDSLRCTKTDFETRCRAFKDKVKTLWVKANEEDLTLVVVGHRLDDAFLVQTLVESFSNIYWVTPEANSHLKKWKGIGPVITAIDARAIDFFHDLYSGRPGQGSR